MTEFTVRVAYFIACTRLTTAPRIDASGTSTARLFALETSCPVFYILSKRKFTRAWWPMAWFVMADDCCHILHTAVAHLWVVPIEDLVKGRAFREMLIDQSEEFLTKFNQCWSWHFCCRVGWTIIIMTFLCRVLLLSLTSVFRPNTIYNNVFY